MFSSVAVKPRDLATAKLRQRAEAQALALAVAVLAVGLQRRGSSLAHSPQKDRFKLESSLASTTEESARKPVAALARSCCLLEGDRTMVGEV